MLKHMSNVIRGFYAQMSIYKTSTPIDGMCLSCRSCRLPIHWRISFNYNAQQMIPEGNPKNSAISYDDILFRHRRRSGPSAPTAVDQERPHVRHGAHHREGQQRAPNAAVALPGLQLPATLTSVVQGKGGPTSCGSASLRAREKTRIVSDSRLLLLITALGAKLPWL